MREFNSESIAIIGMGAIMPGALSLETYWNNILQGKSSIIEVPKNRWDWNIYYDPDPKAKDKTYSKIGGFIENFTFDPLKYRIPPQISNQMDTVQQLAVEVSNAALIDSGYDKKDFDRTRTAVIIGNAMGGAKKEETDLRVYSQYYETLIKKGSHFGSLNKETGTAILSDLRNEIDTIFRPITEDTMPGELANVIAGRIANVLNVNGANFAVDAACATSHAAIAQAVNGLRLRQYDMVVCTGIDQMMTPPAYVKFSKIGALSPDGSFIFDQRANGFVMAEGAGTVILKRLADAVKDKDKIYAVVHAVGSSSDGKGKGITAPNPKGQKLAIDHAFAQVNYSPSEVGLIEAHGTGTKVGDDVELNVLTDYFSPYKKAGTLPIGSIKSQIGHSKAAAGIASVIKTAMAIYNKTLPGSINCVNPSDKIDWKKSPLKVQTKSEPWNSNTVRRAHVSSFGFGGTNFHCALAEFDPTNIQTADPRLFNAEIKTDNGNNSQMLVKPEAIQGEKLTFSAKTKEELFKKLEAFKNSLPDTESFPIIKDAAKLNSLPTEEFAVSFSALSNAKIKGNIDFLVKTSQKIDVWKEASLHLNIKGIYPFRPAQFKDKIAFIFPGQGSQYVDMMKDLASKYQIVRDTFDEADEILKRLIDTTLTEVIWSTPGDTKEQLEKREEAIKQTQMTQPAVLTANIAMMRLLNQLGIKPDMVMGHSLGEYAAAVAAGIFTFENGLRAVTNRAKEMSEVKVDDTGRMASVAWPCDKVEEVLKKVKGYVVAANKNCPQQTVIAGEGPAVHAAIEKFTELGVQAVIIPVSHAFHSEIIAPAIPNYRKFLNKIPLSAPKIPLLSNVTAEMYPDGEAEIRDLLIKQITSSVEWIRQLQNTYDRGVRLFIECGPKRVLSAFATGTLEDKKDIKVLASNHPKRGGIYEFNDLLANLEASGVKISWNLLDPKNPANIYTKGFSQWVNNYGVTAAAETKGANIPAQQPSAAPLNYGGHANKSVVISGIAAGTPGSWDKVFREGNLDEILRGQNLIEPVSKENQQKQIDKEISFVYKSPDGNHRIEHLKTLDSAIKLAGQKGAFDFEKEFGLPNNWVKAMDITTKLSMAAGILALKDAGIPLVQHYKQTSTGGYLPERWGLPLNMTDDTGVIFASAFPTSETIISEVSRYLTYSFRTKTLEEFQDMYDQLLMSITDSEVRKKLNAWFASNFGKHLNNEEERYNFNRSFLLQAIPFAHAQLCQWIYARGPATHISAACASTTQAISIAEDWIKLGRAKRVIVIAADDVTNETVQEWVLSGFLASGAATTKASVSDAALPFDKRRHGMIVGMAAVGIIVEAEEEVAKRAMRPLARILGTEYVNSAFHPMRLDVNHVSEVMEKLVTKVEQTYNLDRAQMSKNMLFMSHETYTPARGGSASAEVNSLKYTFKNNAQNIIVANVKGFTGHSMAASAEDVINVRALNTGIVPPIANYKVADPELEGITLSAGGLYDLKYSLRLAAGFGSQLAMSLIERTWVVSEPRIINSQQHTSWLKAISGEENPVLEVVNNTLRVKSSYSIKGGKNPGVTVATQHAYVDTANRAAPQTAAPKQATAQTQQPAPQTNHVHVQTLLQPSGKPGRAQEITEEILDVVSEKTGYPKDMLDINLDMEADLGIDTVKQAELFAVIREKYNIERQEGVQLKDYPTINHTIKFVLSNLGIHAAQTVQPAPTSNPAVTSPSEGSKPLHQSAAASIPVAPQHTAAPAPATGKAAEIAEEILDIVSEKTGYPKDMLDINLDMEADLGIDTVKQAELFAVIREKYNIERQEGVQLKDYPTINHTINFVLKNLGIESSPVQPATAAPVQTVQQTAAPATGKAAEITEEILDIVSEKTGYPKDMLDINLDMEADLGIDTVKQAELFAVIREKYNIERQDGVQLKDYPTISHTINFVLGNLGIAGINAPAQTVQPAPTSNPAVTSPSEGSKPLHQSAAASIPVAPQHTAAPAPATGKAAEITEDVLNIVSEKTGYPKDMLDINLDMEADLGIDTVKQAELFAVIREKYNIERQEGVQLKDYPTIGHTINFVLGNLGIAGISAPAQTVQPAPTSNPAVTSPSEASKPLHQSAAASIPVVPQHTAAPAEGKTAQVTEDVLNIVSEKTGYPKDMLDINLDMEADLGIDTVKQAELFAVIREKYNIERQEGIQLKDYPTISHTINFVLGNMGAAGQATTQTQAAASQETKLEYDPTRNIRLIPEHLDVVNDASNPLNLSSDRPVIILADNHDLAKEFQARLKAKYKVDSFVFSSKDSKNKNFIKANFDSNDDTLNAFSDFYKTHAKVQGVICLMGCEKFAFNKDAKPHDQVTRYIMPVLIACKVFADHLADRSNADTFMAVNTTLDGSFCYKTKKPFDPIYGGIIGTAQCIRKDMIHVAKCQFKLMDFAQDLTNAEIAEKALTEVLSGCPRGQVGFNKKGRGTIVSFGERINKEVERLPLEGKTFAVTGGGRGLGALFSQLAAKRYKCRVIILDIIKLFPETEKWAKMSEAQLQEVKNQIWQELKADTSIKATPVMLEKRFTAVKDSVTLFNNMQAIKTLGSEADYFPCDVTNDKMVEEIVGKIKAKYGQIDGLVHFAGLERSKLITDKDLAEFYMIFDVKAKSALKFVSTEMVKKTGFYVFISSIAGKFGNLGQSDYACASDYIAKLSVSLHNQKIRSIAVDMGPYAGVGMAIRPGVKAFLESQGTEFVYPEEGMNAVLDELIYGNIPEIVLTAPVGQLDVDYQVRYNRGESQDGGLNPVINAKHPLIETVDELEKGKILKSHKEFSITTDTYLVDHAINNTPYVPGVMGIETFMEAAGMLIKQPNALKNIKFKVPIKLLKNRPQTAYTQAIAENGGKQAKITVSTEFVLKAKGKEVRQKNMHFSAETADLKPSFTKAMMPKISDKKLVTKEKIYSVYFHGPSFQVLDSILSIDGNKIVGVYKQPKTPLWQDGVKRSLTANPLLIEAAFQTCGYRDLHLENRMALPDSIDELFIKNDAPAPAQLYVLGVFKSRTGNISTYDAYVFDKNGTVWAELRGYNMIGQ